MSVESPCIKVCVLDATGSICTGCFRTLDEIGLWPQLGDDERARVLAALQERRHIYESTGGRQWASG
jgi:hypothetical protein